MASPALFRIVEHSMEAAHIREFPRATGSSQDLPLRLHIKQYLPLDNPSPRKGDVTIIAAHANGFPKELYEPLWDDLHGEAARRGLRIRAIWIADAAWQGYSGLINRHLLGNDPSWHDYARDIVHMVNTFRMPRPLFAIGHSFGANALVNAALAHPRLFQGLVLLDPVMQHIKLRPDLIAASPVALSARRRDAWPSRQAAAAAFRSSAFYQLWDSRVLDKWLLHGLRPLPGEAADGAVTLTTTRHQEVFTFVRPSWPAFDPASKELTHPEMVPDLGRCITRDAVPYPFYRNEPSAVLEHLPRLRPSVLYILGGKGAILSSRLRRERSEMTGSGPGGSGGPQLGRVKEVNNPDHGHLIPLEAPAFCALEAAAWLEIELARWLAEEEEFDQWASRPAVEKVTIDDDFAAHLGLKQQAAQNQNAKL